MQIVLRTSKKCSKCKEIKELKSFSAKVNSLDRKSAWCKDCHKKACKVFRSKKAKENSLLYFITRLLKIVKHRAKIKNKEFNICVDDIIELYINQNGYCSISKIKLTWDMEKGYVYTNLSIDRIDNNKGYIKDNIHLVCCSINSMKNTLTMEEFSDMCKLVVLNLPTTNIKEI